MNKIIVLPAKVPPCKAPICNLTWLQVQQFVKSGRGVVRLESLMHRLTICELRSLRERVLSNAPGSYPKHFKRWLKIADITLQAINDLNAAIRSITAMVAPGHAFALPVAA